MIEVTIPLDHARLLGQSSKKRIRDAVDSIDAMRESIILSDSSTITRLVNTPDHRIVEWDGMSHCASGREGRPVVRVTLGRGSHEREFDHVVLRGATRHSRLSYDPVDARNRALRVIDLARAAIASARIEADDPTTLGRSGRRLRQISAILPAVPGRWSHAIMTATSATPFSSATLSVNACGSRLDASVLGTETSCIVRLENREIVIEPDVETYDLDAIDPLERFRILSQRPDGMIRN